MPRTKKIVLFLLILLLARAAGLAEPTLESLGRPCRAFNVLAGRDVVDPAGNEWLVLANTNELTGCELVFIDFLNNTGKVFRAPAGQGAWALQQVGDKLVVGTYYDGQFIVFDLKEMKFIKSAGFPGEKYIWSLAQGSDGRLYGGSYPGAKLGAFDLSNLTVENCGAPAAPDLYLRNVSATPDGRIVCRFGMQNPVTMVFDPKTRRFSAAPRSIESVDTGVSWNGLFLSGNGAYSMPNFAPVDPPPFPAPLKEKGEWKVDDYASTNDLLFIRQGASIYRFAKGDKDLTLITDQDLHARLIAGSSKGDALFVRGPEYFVVQPGQKEIKPRAIPVEPSPRATHFLRADSDGRLWGGPMFGQTLFWLDVATKQFQNTSVICNSGGEVYDVAFLDGKVYAVSYSGGDIVEFDPAQPWDQLANKNPRTIAHLADRGYIRPVGGIVVGPNKKLYSGWMAKYGTYGGAVAITDPADGKTELIENPIGQQAISGLDADDAQLYIGTSLGANGLDNKDGEPPHFGVIELATRKVVKDDPFPGATEVNRIFYDRASKRVYLNAGGRHTCYIPATKEFVTSFAAKAPLATSRSVDGAGDGHLIYASGKSVLSLDLTTGNAWPIADAPAKVENVATDGKGNVFVSCGAEIYRIPLRNE